MRTMADCDNPAFFAISRVLQCVLLAGMDSSVLVTTASTCLSAIERGAPGRVHLRHHPASRAEYVDMHVASLSAYERFVNFDFAWGHPPLDNCGIGSSHSLIT